MSTNLSRNSPLLKIIKVSYTTIVGFLRAYNQTHRHFEASRLFFFL